VAFAVAACGAMLADMSELIQVSPDYRVLRFREWCALAGISERTGKRLLASGRGPTITRLSERRIGIAISAHRRWLAERAREDFQQDEPMS
jgi:predicted DNA-binding transcriptional regulator AlpA